MGTISSALSSYAQLSSLQSGTSGTSSNTGTVANLTASLLAALDSSSDSSSSGSNNAYTLNLSSAAQALIGGSDSSSSTNSATSSSFTLSTSQQKAISSILQKYKDAPFTQATFDDIQNDLQAAGLDSNTLALQDQAKNFNPTSVLLGALSGNYSDTTSVSSSTESAKQSNYMQSIVSQWKAISTTADSSATATSTTA